MARDKLSARLEHEYLTRVRIGHIDVVLRIDGHALRRRHRFLRLVLAVDELVFALCEIENMHARRARIGDDDASARIGNQTVGPHQEAIIGRPRYDIHQLVPESPVWLHLGLRLEIVLPGQLASAIERHLPEVRLCGSLRLL